MFGFTFRRKRPKQYLYLQQPKRQLVDFDPVEIWNYRQLIPLFVRRDFVAEFSHTILGPLWFIIHPVMQSVVFALVFGNLAKISTDSAAPFLFYNSSLVLWIYFTQCTTYVSQTFLTNAGLFGKVYFPRIIVPIATSLFRMVTLIVNYTVFIIFLIIFKLNGAAVSPNWWILATPLLILQTAMTALGLGTFASAFTARSRDMIQAIGYLLTVWMYATPVIYPLSAVPEPYRVLYYLNPMTSIIEIFRHAYLGVGSVDLMMWGVNGLQTLCIFVLGLTAFTYAQKTVVDTV